MHGKALRLIIALAVFVSAFATTIPASAGPSSCLSSTSNNFKKLLECVTLQGVREHQAAFQQIADDNDGTRAAGTAGYEASVDYVVSRLEDSGYSVTLNSFPYLYHPPVILQQLTPFSAVYPSGEFTGTGYGTVTGAVVPVDVKIGLPGDVTSGCEAADFAGFPAGSIALIQRGTCTFAMKALNAQAAGAIAVIIFNQGNTPDREGLIIGTLGGPNVVTIPVVGASYFTGVLLAEYGSSALIQVDPPVEVTQTNVLAESKYGDPSNVVMAGAHLDSVTAGPGINDNGSGSAALLEVAEQMATVKTRNKVRFAWWGAEEGGLIGSTAYVNGLSQSERNAIALYLNFDMIGSPNHVFFIYDGDNSNGGGAAGPAGSAAIEKTFERYYTGLGMPFKGSPFTGRSDYGPFVAIGIPSGGLFTGAEGVKTPEEASLWGGIAGAAYDPCYHLACDTYANNNDTALDVNSDGVAYAVLQYGMSTADINGKKGKGNFQVAPIDPLPVQ